jgi:hypothetical protein
LFERHHEKLLPRKKFFIRLIKYALISISVIAFSLLIGMVGYHQLEGLPWVDSFLNAAMLMGGMGPINALHNQPAKIFAGIYALYCGMVLLIAVGIFAAPILHRFLHRFHLESEEN